MSDEFTEMSVWRDYERGAVGVQLPGQPRKLITPQKARDMADRLLERFDDDTLDAGDGRAFIADLREFADDVEGSA